MRKNLRDVVVFSGSAHRSLAGAICADLGVPLESVELTRFSNDCLQVQLQANCRQRDVYLDPAPRAAHPGAPDGAAADGRRGPGCLGGRDHGGDPALRLRPLGQEGRLADLPRRPAGRRPAGHRRRAPGAHHDPARAPGARLLLGARRPAHALWGSWPTTSSTQDLTDSVVVSPDLGNAKTATQFARLLGLPVAAGSKQRLADDRVVIDAIVGRRRRQARHRPRRRDRHRWVDRRAARPAGRRRAAPGRRSSAPTGSSSARRSTVCGATR